VSQVQIQKKLWPIHLLMLMAATLVATSFTVGKAIAPGMDPVLLTFIRFVVASVFFLPFVAKRNGLARPTVKDFGRYGMISLSLVIFFAMMFWSLHYTTALNTSVIFTLVPGISGIYSALLIRERLSSYRISALLLATLGAVWVVFHGDINRLLDLEYNVGDLIFFFGCLTMAAYPPLVRFLHRGEPMMVMTFWVMVTACGWLTILLILKLPLELHHVEPKIWGGIVYLAIFCTIITFWLTKISTLHLGPTRVMSYSFLYPPLVIAIDYLFGHPLPGLHTWLGVLLILPAMFVIQAGGGAELSSSQPERSSPQ
jgi:drug/metabolite transporter (DMT)-like permease